MASKRQQLFVHLFFLFSVLVSQATLRAIHDTSLTQRHEQSMARYGHSYRDAVEKEKRCKSFKASVEYIDSFKTAENKPYRLSVNEFADLTNEEFKASHTGASLRESLQATSFRYMNFTAVPLSIDWREKGAVSPVREGACGGWTVSAVDAVEGITKIKTSMLFTLSVQEIVDCNSSGNPGCDGGSTYEAFEFIKRHGLTTEANYHSGGKGTCNAKIEDEPVTKITSYENVPANSEEE